MAFVKRTWLARIGTGLNKFIIGDRDGNNKQTLTNSPDSVTQQGDVISAENLNDLEGRIETAFGADSTRMGNIETSVLGMKLTKLWENSSPSSAFAEQTISLGTVANDIVIEYSSSKETDIYRVTKFIHIHKESDSSYTPFIYISESRTSIITAGSMMIGWERMVGLKTEDGVTKVLFQDAYSIANNNGSAVGAKDNDFCIPIRIYKVGNIYTS